MALRGCFTFKKIAREMEKSSFNSLVPFFMGNYDFVIIIIELYLVVRGRNRIDIKICAINEIFYFKLNLTERMPRIYYI